MKIDQFRETIRAVLGDRQVHGLWHYDDQAVDSAVRSIFLLGKGPAGYGLDGARKQVVPEPSAGDVWALISYEAAMLMVAGEDGAMSYRTKAVAVHDGGHRKRDLMAELRLLIYRIRDGGAVFATAQNFIQFVHSGVMKEDLVNGVFGNFTEVEMRTGVQDLEI